MPLSALPETDIYAYSTEDYLSGYVLCYSRQQTEEIILTTQCNVWCELPYASDFAPSLKIFLFDAILSGLIEFRWPGTQKVFNATSILSQKQIKMLPGRQKTPNYISDSSPRCPNHRDVHSHWISTITGPQGSAKYSRSFAVEFLLYQLLTWMICMGLTTRTISTIITSSIWSLGETNPM